MRDRREQQAVLLGMMLGAVSGAAIGFVFSRWRRRHSGDEGRAIKPTQIVRLGGAIATVVRQVLELLA